MDSDIAISCTEQHQGQNRLRLFTLCAIVASFSALALNFSGCLDRVELQSTNRMFEARPWLKWSQTGLHRLNPVALWKYHEAHEIPHRIWAWDYTLSWAIADNHAPVKHKFIIFNHLLEDEPPPDAVAEHPWMEPLLRHPVSRKTVAAAVRFLAQNGARLIILDNDFPQYSDHDKDLAAAIHDCSTGKFSGRSIPVLMASTINRRSFNGGMQLDAMTMPVGILSQLQKLEPGTDTAEKYTGLTTVLLDQDQVVRRIACNLPNAERDRESIAVKALRSMAEPPAKALPSVIDIDFASPPNSETYPVRPFSYLLDPEKQKEITSANSEDVTVGDAVVILGDGVQDVYATPLTNVGVNLMSGAEILAHSIDTISRTSWLQRLSAPAQAVYLIACCIIAATVFSLTRKQNNSLKCHPAYRLWADWCLCILLSCAAYFAGFLWFAFAGLIVPVVVPAIAVAVGTLAGVLYERERERLDAMLTRIMAMEASIRANRETHESQLRIQAAESQAKELALDQQRRSEFVRRINHDLKAPVTVLNWTLAKLKREGLHSATAPDRIEHIERTSDRLFGLIAELVHCYCQTSQEVSLPQPPRQELSDICIVLANCVQMERSVGEMQNCAILLHLPSYPMVTSCSRLELERIVDNLLCNAILHNPAGTIVEVSARTRANHHQISVSDNGAGISKINMANIFNSGFTTSSTGEGLGLSIVKTLVDRLGGTITVESEHDVGTTFTVSLPASSIATTVADPNVLPLNALAVSRRG